MQYRFVGHIVLIILLLNLFGLTIKGQQPALERGSVAFFDSINTRISHLEEQISHLKQNRNVAYLNLQRELEHTQFTRSFEEDVADEDLDKAKELVESKIEKSEFRKDQSSVAFYRQYEDHVYTLIKQQRMYYQQLFQKEKNFKKQFEKYTDEGDMTSLQKAQRMVDLALKYARENNLSETIKYLELYRSYTQALIFDAESVYDLALLTNNKKEFDKVFQPLIASDSLEGIQEAEVLLDHCMNYGRLTGSSLDGEFFKKQELIIASALSDMLDKQGREKELARYTDQSVVAHYDKLNPCGVFKWHDQIVVIDEFIPTASIENVKKGEAIIHADKMLATYLQKNKLCKSIDELKFGYAFIIPYQSNAKNTSFFYNQANRKWQYIVCYTLVVNPEYTRNVSKFMPPLFFEDEMDMVNQ